MDIEGTIQFILESQAKHEGHMAALDERMTGISKLIQQGMQLLLSFQTESTYKINALIDAQQRSETKIDRLADSLQKLIDLKNPNGH